MTDITTARLAGVLSHIAAAGHITRQVLIDTPDGAPMTLTVIDAGRARAPGRKRTSRRGIEPDQSEQVAEGADRPESPTKWAQDVRVSPQISTS
jgi:hypothetical protein